MRLIALFSLILVALGKTQICPDRVITSSRLLEVQGIHLNVTTFNCASSRLNNPFKPMTDSEVFTKRTDVDFDVEKRQVGECTLPEPNCICGVGCTGTQCFSPRGPILQSDCTQLGLALIQAAGTFLIEPGQGQGVTFNTCTYAVVNNEASNLQEYCFNTLGNVGFSQLNTGCPSEEALCGGGTLLGVSRFFVEQLSSSTV